MKTYLVRKIRKLELIERGLWLGLIILLVGSTSLLLWPLDSTSPYSEITNMNCVESECVVKMWDGEEYTAPYEVGNVIEEGQFCSFVIGYDIFFLDPTIKQTSCGS